MTLSVHPAAEYFGFPLLADDDWDRFKEDIKNNGQLEKITLHEGQIADGRNRYRACQELGLQAQTEPYTGTQDIYDFVWSKNFHRRHLSPSQKAAAAAKRAKLTRRDFVGNRYKKVECEATSHSKGALAAQIGVSKRTIDGAARALRESAEVFKAIEEGKISVDTAERILKLPKPEQAAALAAACTKSKRSTGRTQASRSVWIDPVQQEFLNIEAQQLAIINAPSSFPADAPLPVHPNPVHTPYICEAIVELRKLEPQISSMTEGQLFKLIHPYTQRIQTYGKFGRGDGFKSVTGPIDQRFVSWAGDCFGKLRARQAILAAKEKRAEKRRAAKGLPPTRNHARKETPKPPKPKRGDEFTRLWKTFAWKLKRALSEIPSQYEEQLITQTTLLIKDTLAEKRAAYTRRVSTLHSNGAQAP